jgi:hypothetical protein
MLVCLVRKVFLFFAHQLQVMSKIIRGAHVSVIIVGEEGLQSILLTFVCVKW